VEAAKPGRLILGGWDMESPLYWMQQPLKKYADFNGRARRMEYWMFVLLNIAVSVAATIVDTILGMGGMIGGIYGPVTCLAFLALLIPGIAVAARRLHDQDKSGWWLLIGFVPIIGGIVLLVFMFLEGTRGDNQYGPDPKAGVAPAI
jgi:uncharacterized membrane protein YhaH (DUF805 family)